MANFVTLYIGNLLLPLMGEDFLRSCFKDLGDDIHQMVHSIAVHYNPLRPRQLMKGHAFITFQNPAAASSALTSIINGTWANNSDDPLCLAKTRMIVTPVKAKPHSARAKLSASSLPKTADEATLAAAFAGCPGFCGQQILCDYNPFGSTHIQKFQQIPNCYGKSQTGPLGRADIYFETAKDAAHALRTMKNVVIHGMPIKLQRPRESRNVQPKPFVKPRATRAAMKFAEAPILASAAKPFVLNPAAAPFVPAKWANKKAAPAAFSPAEPAKIAKIAARRVPFRPISAAAARFTI